MPLFKSGDHLCPMNYYATNRILGICKDLEKIIVIQLTDYLDTHNLFSPLQFGFHTGLSVTDQLFACNYISHSCDAGFPVDVSYFDFKKAFNVVNHQMMLTKLSSLGVGARLL